MTNATAKPITSTIGLTVVVVASILATSAHAQSSIRNEIQRNGVTVRVLQSDCADGTSPLQVVTDDPASLPAVPLVGNTLANAKGSMSIECQRAMNIFEAPVVTPAGERLSDGYLYANVVGWTFAFDRSKLTGPLEKWFRQDPTARAQFIHILSGHFADNPANITGDSPMAQIIYAFSRKDAQWCPQIVGETAELAWKSYFRSGSFESWNNGRFKVDAGLAPTVMAIFEEGNRPAPRVSRFASRGFDFYECDAPEMWRMRDAVARKAVQMYGATYTTATAPAKTDTRAAKPRPSSPAKTDRVFTWAPTVEAIQFTSGGKSYGGADVERLVKNTLIHASWNQRRQYGRLPKRPMYYSHWKTFKDDDGTIYLAGVDRQTNTLDVREIDVSEIRKSLADYNALPDDAAQQAFLYEREPDLEYYAALKEGTLAGVESDVFNFRAFDADRVGDFDKVDKSYVDAVAELKDGG